MQTIKLTSNNLPSALVLTSQTAFIVSFPFVKLQRQLDSLNEDVLFLLREEPLPALTIEVTNF